MQFNTKLSQRAIDQIETHPQLFDQTAWCNSSNECGTAHCWYGWCLVLDGYVFDKITFFNSNAEILNLAEYTTGLQHSSKEFKRITAGSNTLDDIKYFHAKLASGESIEFDRFGYDDKGFDEWGYNFEGFDNMGYDRQGYDDDGLTEDGRRAEDDYNRAEYYRSDCHGVV